MSSCKASRLGKEAAERHYISLTLRNNTQSVIAVQMKHERHPDGRGSSGFNPSLDVADTGMMDTLMDGGISAAFLRNFEFVCTVGQKLFTVI